MVPYFLIWKSNWGIKFLVCGTYLQWKTNLIYSHKMFMTQRLAFFRKNNMEGIAVLLLCSTIKLMWHRVSYNSQSLYKLDYCKSFISPYLSKIKQIALWKLKDERMVYNKTFLEHVMVMIAGQWVWKVFFYIEFCING